MPTVKIHYEKKLNYTLVKVSIAYYVKVQPKTKPSPATPTGHKISLKYGPAHTNVMDIIKMKV